MASNNLSTSTKLPDLCLFRFRTSVSRSPGHEGVLLASSITDPCSIIVCSGERLQRQRVCGGFRRGTEVFPKISFSLMHGEHCHFSLLYCFYPICTTLRPKPIVSFWAWQPEFHRRQESFFLCFLVQSDRSLVPILACSVHLIVLRWGTSKENIIGKISKIGCTRSIYWHLRVIFDCSNIQPHTG